MNTLVRAGRLLFGAWLLAHGVNHFLLPLWVEPTGHEPAAVQLMSAFVHSGLLDVAMAVQGVAGAMILAGIALPAALCVVMPVSTCALYWAAVLDRDPLTATLAVLAFALNGALMLAYLDHYRGALERDPAMSGESARRNA